MRVFLTGATGFIGSAIVRELIDAGHQVLGLARSDAGAETAVHSGAEVQRGSLEDVDALRTAAASADAVIHTAFDHDFSQFAMHCENDRRVIEALGSVLEGTGKSLLITSVTGIAAIEPGTVAKEEDPPVSTAVHPRASSEEAAHAVAKLGCRTLSMRMPQVHDTKKHGLWDYTMQIAREKGVAAYIGDGLNRWPAAHVLDTARLYRLALEKGQAGAVYNAVAEEGVAMHDIAGAIGQRLNAPVVSLSPEEAEQHFGWLARVVGLDLPASSEKTRHELSWNPTHPGMISDLLNATEPNFEPRLFHPEAIIRNGPDQGLKEV